MRYLVTGGTGFIGTALVSSLIRLSGASAVTCLVKPSAKESEILAVNWLQKEGVHLINGDLMAEPVSAEPPPPVDIVFHLAANTDTDAPESALRVNDTGIERLLNWLGAGCEDVRIVYSSTVAVSDRNGPVSGPLNEMSPCVPRTAYGLTKLRGEEILRSRAESGKYTYTILRLPTVYGPGQKKDGLFDLMRDLAARGALPARLNWPGKTSVIHVKDVAAIMADLAQRPEAANEMYCVASDESPTVSELAQKIGENLGRPIRVVDVPFFVWSFLRWIAWNRMIRALIPRFATVMFWRLSLIVDHGFWFDTRKLRSVYTRPLLDLTAGLAETATPQEKVRILASSQSDR